VSTWEKVTTHGRAKSECKVQGAVDRLPINGLKRDQNAVILAHDYMTP